MASHGADQNDWALAGKPDGRSAAGSADNTAKSDSLDVSLQRCKDILEKALLQHQAAMVLEEVKDQVVQSHQSAVLSELDRESTGAQERLRQQEAMWSGVSVYLAKQLRELEQSFSSVQSETRAQEQELDSLRQRIEQLRQEERIIHLRKQARTLKRDLSSLPNLVLRNVITFLHVSDFSVGIAVCRRWKHYLEKGYLWKALLVRQEVDYVRGRERYLASQIVMHRKVQISLEPDKDKKKGKGLDKERVFQNALQKVQMHLTNANSVKEDLKSKHLVDKEVHSFLRKKLQSLRHQLGLARVEQGKWKYRIQKSVESKAALARAMAKHEETLAELRASHEKVLESSDAELQEMESKIAVLQELQAIGQQVQSSDERERHAAAAETARELKKQKKLLVKEVKHLRGEIDQATAVRDSYKVKLSKLVS